MKLLDILKDMFETLPKNGNIKAFLHEQKARIGAEDFCQLFFQWFGGRGGNEYLDYGLAALKFAKLFDNLPWGLELYSDKDYHHGDCFASLIVERLLFDDRHDLYQNVPYYLEDFLTANKAKKDELKSFWDDVANILIDSFNENGTGDITYGQKL